MRRDGWLSWYGGWLKVGSAPIAAKAGLTGSNPDMSKNYKINNIYKGVANTKLKIHILTANLLAAKLHPILSYDICMCCNLRNGSPV